jgi:hypothetical protein
MNAPLLMARAVCSSAPLSGVAPFLRTCRLSWGLVCHVSVALTRSLSGLLFPPGWGPSILMGSQIKFYLRKPSTFKVPVNC